MKYTITFFFPNICSYKGGKYKAFKGVDLAMVKDCISLMEGNKDDNVIMRVYKGKYAPWDDEFDGTEYDRIMMKYCRCTRDYFETHKNEMSEAERKFLFQEKPILGKGHVTNLMTIAEYC